MDASEEFHLKERYTHGKEPQLHDNILTTPPRQASLSNYGNFSDSHLSSHDLTERLIRDGKLRQLRPGSLRRSGVGRASCGTDLNAMSVASLYDKEGDTKEMDTDNEFLLTDNNCEVRIYLPDMMEDFELATIDNKDVNHSREHGDEPTKKCNNNNNDGASNPFDANQLCKSLYFEDGKRSIDFVLVWKSDSEDRDAELNADKQKVYLENLKNEGLELEIVSLQLLNFVKIHAPIEVLRRYSEILKLRLPMKQLPGMSVLQTKTESVLEQFRGCARDFLEKIFIDQNHFPTQSHRFTAIYSRDKEYLFDITQNNFFTGTIRSRIVQFILDRKRFSHESDDYAFGIDRLIQEGVYIAAYPLHDGEITTPGSMRRLLYNEWAAISKWYRYQPLDYVKEYFGVKIGLYFAWLGFYTYMLLLASVVGIGCFLYSWFTLQYNTPSLDVCDTTVNITMCPLCDYWCDYWQLSETCFHAKIAYLFDNPTTVFFAVFMSFWATLFLELWKRYSAEITHRWDLTGFDVHEEHPRPEYLARLKHVQRTRLNSITNQPEPEVPFWRMKLPATVFSFSVVLLLIALAMAAVLGVVLYRISTLATLTRYKATTTTSEALFFTTATAATINLFLIVIFNYMYTLLAEYLTELELLRTQTEFDDSLTLKIYLLQFVNYYASIFYIAFFKGKFIGYPGKYSQFFDYRQEECGPGGCLMELCIQLAIIMVGKQALNTVLEMLWPKFERWYNMYKVRKGKAKSSFSKGHDRWVRDLKLVEWGPRSLFPEYLEMVLQYGFVTIFVAAFPLAPFFALLNNMLEMRLDAKKLLTHHRRPVGQRVRDIGVWYRILDSVGKLSVITNGFIIAFTSDFIPRMVYRGSDLSDGTLTGYLNFTLSYFNTSQWEDGSGPKNGNGNVTLCRYPDYRYPPWSSPELAYERTTFFWHILAARLAFIVIFENFVALVMIIVRWCIPDMSHDLNAQIRREAYITNEIIIKQETHRAAGGRRRFVSLDDNNIELVKMEHLMDPGLSASQLDLVMHGPDNPIAPGHCAPDQYKRATESFLDVEKGKEPPINIEDEIMAPVSL